MSMTPIPPGQWFQIVSVGANKRPTVLAKGMMLEEANRIRKGLAKDEPDVTFTVEPEPDMTSR